MSMIAEFTIIGRVGAIKTVGTTLRVTIASNYPRKNDRGEWVDNTKWNEITIFSETTKSYVERNMRKGDLVHASGVLGQTSYERDGNTVYTMTLACHQINLLARAPSKEDAPQEINAAAPQMADDDISF